MKITNFIIIYLIIALPLLVFGQWRSEDTNTFAKLNKQYDEAMTISSHDAVDQLRMNAMPNYESGYASKKFSRINKEPAYETFIHSLALNFQTEDADKASKDLLSRYVPVFAILEYDGFSMNVFQQYKSGRSNVFDRVWLTKIPFTHHDGMGNIVQFTLDGYAIVYDPLLKEWIEGEREELVKDTEINQSLRNFLSDEKKFHRVRQDTIVNTIQDNLAYQINEHNVYTKSLGITYKFTLPLIAQEDWYNTIDDVGVISFFQGYPYQRVGGVYNQYAFAGTKIVKQDSYLGSIVNGKKMYHAESCEFPHPVLEIFSSKKDAAKAGYYELSCLNK